MSTRGSGAHLMGRGLGLEGLVPAARAILSDNCFTK